ncbi:MAG TPA: hypothetical protein DGH68_10700 [Bacteroidetes bacterium]|jgi:uncharacterized membrane protein|nr:hypothetical protein [Bacteroidota bacterium]
MSETKRTILGELRNTFVRGSVVIIPVVLTYWFFSAFLNAIDGILSPLFEKALGLTIPGLGFFSMVLLVLIVGLLSRNLVGRVVFGWLEKLVESVPFVRGVYGAIKDLIGAFTLGGKGRTFRQVVLVEYPRAGLYTIAFVTNEMTFSYSDKRTLDFVNVYIPNPPNPTSGVLILVPKKDAVVLDLTIEQGLKLVLSGGIVTPEVLAQK